VHRENLTAESLLALDAEEIPLADFAKAAKVRLETVSSSPVYRDLPRYRRGRRSYVRVADALAFLEARRRSLLPRHSIAGRLLGIDP
jgi:hypothetical protein